MNSFYLRQVFPFSYNPFFQLFYWNETKIHAVSYVLHLQQYQCVNLKLVEETVVAFS